MVFITPKELFCYLMNYYYLKKGNVFISTFNIYLDITAEVDYGLKAKKSPARLFIESVNKKDLYLLIGIPMFFECKPNCPECRKNYNSKLDRVKKTVETLGLINVRYHAGNHMKLYMVGEKVFTGGINLTDSNYFDFSIEVENPKRSVYEMLFKKVWSESQKTLNNFYI